MIVPAASAVNPWHAINKFFTRKLTILQILANLVGTAIVTSYFMFFDPNLKIQCITNDLIVIGVMFVGLVFIATFFLHHRQKDLIQFIKLKSRDQAVELILHKIVQQKIPWSKTWMSPVRAFTAMRPAEIILII
jgi:hypothetical protein